MENYGKSPLKSCEVCKENPKFSHIATFSPPEASFFLAFGTGLIESLNRLRSLNAYVDPVWKKLDVLLSGLECQSEEQTELLDAFKTLLGSLRDAPEDKWRVWLDYYLENNYQDAALAMNFSIRLLLSAISRNDEFFIEPFIMDRHGWELERISEGLGISILIIEPESPLKIISSSLPSPLVCIGRSEDDKYYTAYHRLHFKPPTSSLAEFPFLYFKLPDSEEDALIQIMCKELLHKNVKKRNLLSSINKVIDKHPAVDYSFVQELKNQINN